MIEHRLIERMIEVMGEELLLIEKEKKVDPEFIGMAVDFIRTYADRCHHGKEEDILFRDLGAKKLTDDHRRTMEDLVEEHRFGRKVTAKTRGGECKVRPRPSRGSIRHHRLHSVSNQILPEAHRERG